MASDVREIHQLMRDLGYEQTRNGGHAQYTHPEIAGVITVAGSPSDHRWRANIIAELKRRHPEAFKRQKASPDVRAARRRSRKQMKSPATEAQPLTVAERRQIQTRPSVADRLARNGITPIEAEAIPNPGSPEAVTAGCTCARFENNHGVGLDDREGVFAVRLSCPLHGDEHRCECGNPLPKQRLGRPRKWCLSCRPSAWQRMSDEQRRKTTERVMRWQAKHKEPA